jgi:oxygen-dependent protoporphyrinogen oxidase
LNILVIGGGISGLSCAWQLRQRRLPVVLLERSGRFGGVIDRADKNGCHFDVGPQSFSATEPISRLIEQLGLAGEVLRADPRAPRYILLRGRLVPAPMSPVGILATPLIGWRTKLRLLAEPFQRTRPPECDESIAAFVRRKFGEDLLNNLVAPFVSGVYAGDPERLSLASAFPDLQRLEERYGSVIRGTMKSRRKGGGPRPTLCNFKNGMTTLTSALASQLGADAVPRAEVTMIRRSDTGFQVRYRVDGLEKSLDARAIVMATPTPEAAQLLSEIEPRLGKALGQIAYASVVQVCTAYRIEPIRAGRPSDSHQHDATSGPQGFGFLVPRTENLRILGTVWNSALFPGEESGGGDSDLGTGKTVKFTSFLGGATDPEICQRSDDEIARIVHQELSQILSGVMRISGPPAAAHVARWMRALPQYNMGHARVVAELAVLCSNTPGVFLTGNYLAGPSLGACVEQARSVAGDVERFAASNPPLGAM